MLSASSRNRSPFTPNQWQELEQQALVFKYMVTGTPIPPDLIYSIKRIGWGCFEMGFGRKVDPEPGRCRRTDGKKWRCSKEAYPDSKYCERHMHRGRNRSRKPVEQQQQQLVVSSTNTTSLTNTTSSSSSPSPYTNRNISLNNNNSNLTSSFPFSTSMTCHDQSQQQQQQQQPFSQSYQNSSLNPYFYSQQSNSSKPLDHSDFQTQDATTHHLFLDSSSYSHDDKDYRYVQNQ
ncbi:hypothetical protein TSUD_358150 [Trifolium subterraneum]|uniref:Growth-regulating factor n=1 Tax=Trifolium subterraneum TaxID=3900 RepID=A0A2Z6MJ49_TRISU|nr:hypothetical protein TSUD_358150 [Trifolium subterraneum]